MANEEKVPRTEFSGTFLFVNADAGAGHRSTAAQRKAIDAHVQGQYHRWRKQKDARSLRESVRVPVRTRIVGRPSSEDLEEKPSRARTPVTRTSKVKAQIMRFRVTDLNFTSRNEVLVPGPVSFLMKGNSDPFETTAFAITPEVNRIMTFTSTWRIPSLFGAAKPVAESYQISAAYQTMTFALTDACHGCCSLAMATAALAGMTEDSADGRLALSLRNRGAAMVRVRLENSDYRPDFRVLGAIKSLFLAEMTARNYVAAGYHVKMLEFLFSKQYLDQALVTQIKEGMLWLDMHWACSYLNPPLLRIREWLPGEFDSHWTTLLAKPYDEAFEIINFMVDPSVGDQDLRQIFSDFWELRKVDLFLTDKPDFGNGKIFHWMHLRKMDCEARLLQLYCELDPSGTLKQTPSARQTNLSRESLVAACTCLGALAWSGLAFGKRQLTQGREKPLPDYLQCALLACQDDTADDELDSHLLLWILYVGSMLELLAPNASNRVQWYTKQLAVHVKKMELTSWVGVCQILQRFLFSESLVPDHAKWSEEKIFHNSRTPSLDNILSSQSLPR